MKKLLLVLLFLTPLISFSQNYGNEWINYNQKYFKIKVTQEGIYKIDYNTLLNAGVPLTSGSFNPGNIQIYTRGEEQYIYVEGEADGTFNTTDYIEFYANKNDGWMDTQLFNTSKDQANPNVSLFNDTAAYYLTWNTSTANRRMTPENDVNFSTYTASPYFFRISRQDYASTYYKGETNSHQVTDPEYTKAEGWFDSDFNKGGSKTKSISTSNIYATGPNAEVRFVVVSASNYSSINPDHHLRVQFAGLTKDTLYEGYDNRSFFYSVPISNFTSTSTQFVFSSIDDLGSLAARNAIAFISIKYAHTMNLGSSAMFKIQVPANSTKTRYDLQNLNVPSGEAHVYDITNHKRIKVVQNSSTFQTLIPGGVGEKECIITSDGALIPVTNLSAVSSDPANPNKFRNYFTSAGINSDYIFITHKSLLDKVEDYETYRKSIAGGSYKTLILDIDDLYEQFSYGIIKSPLSIRNFAKYAYNNFTDTIDGFFLVGKSHTAEHYRNNLSYYSGTLVPTMGDPASDILLTCGIVDNRWQPAFPTGRLSASAPNDVQHYLDKVQLYETTQKNPEEWMKRVLHFGGGGSENEQQELAGYLNSYKKLIEDTLFGGKVTSFWKTSTVPFQITQADVIKEYINGGVSLLTFFAHAAGVGFDISIDDPSEYNNYGKYPFLLANSCLAGDIFGTGTSSSDAFVLIENKGVIGYLASITLATKYSLNTYSSEFYKNISYANYGKTIGKSIKETVAAIQNNSSMKEICLEMTLHGDPAVILNSQAKPDYLINSSKLFYTPYVVSTEVDSFDLNIISTNIGRAISDTIVVEIERTFPDGITKNTYLLSVPATHFKDTFIVRLPVNSLKGIGNNTIKVILDSYNDVDELNETNNSVTANLYIKSADIIPIFPYNFAIVPTSTVTLKASTSYAFSDMNDYIFELDTNAAFNSSFKLSGTMSHSGGVVEWTPPITFTDSQVYFWRVSLDSSATQSYNWKTNSFQHIAGKHGWSQAHFDQFENNNYQFVNYNKANKIFDFVNVVNTIDVQTEYPLVYFTNQWIKVNNSTWDIGCCTGGYDGIKIAAFSPTSGKPIISKYIPATWPVGKWGDWHCKQYDVYGHDFFTKDPFPTQPGDDIYYRDLIKVFIDSIPNDYYVIAYSNNNHNAEYFSNDLYMAFESIGSGQIRTLQNNKPYIIFGQKGKSIGSAHEMIGLTTISQILLKDSFETKWEEGFVESPIIGPSGKWVSLHWKQESVELVNSDSVRLSVIGINLTGSIDTLITGLPPDSADIYNLDKRVDAQKYPYIKLIAHMKDTSSTQTQTPAQLKRWQVIYHSAPETALNPSAHFTFYKDTLDEGDSVRLSFATENISDYDMDSLLISYWIVDKDRQIHQLGSHRCGKHPKGHILIDSIAVTTKGIPGHNALWIEVNPNNDQFEQLHINNIGEISFYVKSDNTNPIMDITFDGVHILDGDIVSARPEIQISLNDENPFIIMNEIQDTSSFKVFIKYPNQYEAKRIFFTSSGLEIMRFIPADQSNKTCKIEYNAEFPFDGTYELLIQAKDKSNNKSGSVDYNINFEVINKSTITEVMNWPNPFSTYTRFVFTLTGSEIPTYFKIQIMTISGKLIKEIYLDELGPIHIGKNITQYGWDGKDQYGDQLANGIYLYRIITNINGKEIEKNQTSANKYFTKSFGKMYLMR